MSDYRKSIVRIALALIGVAALMLLCMACEEKASAVKAQAQEKDGRLVVTEKAAISTKNVMRRFSGYAHPWETHGVGFLVPGRVSAMNVHEGQFVNKGQLLATIDPEDYVLVEKLAETQVETLQPNYERVDNLVEKNALPQKELDIIKGQYEAAQTQKRQAERQVNYTRLIAPVSGLVYELPTSVGQVIGAGSPAVVLMCLDKLKVKFGVTQKDLGNFEVGKKVTMNFPGVADEVEGAIWHIDYVADSMTRTYNLIIEVDNKDNRLRPSMLAHLDLVQESISGYFAPIDAVIRDNRGRMVLFMLDEKRQVFSREVKIGRRFEDLYEIVEGLAEGETFIVKGNSFVQPGDRVSMK